MKAYTKLMIHLTIIIIGFNLLAACTPVEIGPGEIEALQEGATYWTVNGAATVARQTFTMMKDSTTYWAFFRYMNSPQVWSYQFMNVLDDDPLIITQQLAMGGNCASCSTVADLVNTMLKNGWNFVKDPQNKLPPSFWVGLDAALAFKLDWISAAAAILPDSLDIWKQIVPPAGEIE
jgi:hypothetical protein